MKKIIFLAHDPGGDDVVRPVYEAFPEGEYRKAFWGIGPAGERHPNERQEATNVMKKLEDMSQSHSIALLVTGTSWGNQTELLCIRLCRKWNIPTVSILDYWSNYSNRFMMDSFKGGHIYPDYYFVMDEMAKEEAISDGVPEAILHIVGHPGLDKYFLMGKRKRDFSENNDVLFISQPLSVLYGNTLGFDEYTAFEDLREICEELSLRVHIKFHPKDSAEFRERYINFSVLGDTDDLMLQHGIVVGMNTMALLHGGLMGVPVISYQPNLIGRDGCITNRLGISRACFTRDELKEMLKDDGRLWQYCEYAKMGESSTHKVVEELIQIIQQD